MELREKIKKTIESMFAGIEDDPELQEDCGKKANQILVLIKQAGYVKLADDQSLPPNPYPRMTQCADEDGAIQTFTNPDWMKFHMAEDAMLKAGFRRVEL